MAQHNQTRPVKALDKVDPVWTRIREEAEDDRAPRARARRPSSISTILHHDTLETAVVHASPSGSTIRTCRAS